MYSNVPLDCAFFQLSPRRTRCELFVSADGKTEKLASGFLKPFLTHLKVAEEQASHDVHVINLEVGRRKNAAMWFNKGTVERFVRFVSTPEVLELVNTLDAEMSQLEGARKMYSQGARDQLSGESESKSAAAADATKKELLRAIDVRLTAVKQDLATACARASAAGFNLESVSELLLFADQFRAIRLSEASKNFLSLPRRRPELINDEQSLPSPAIHLQYKSFNDANVRSSSGSDMSIDEAEVEQTDPARSATFQCGDAQLRSISPHQQQQQAVGVTAAATTERLKPDSQHLVQNEMEKVDDTASTAVSSAKSAQQAGGGSKRLTVQDRINLFESKQKEQSANPNVGGSSFGGPIVSRLAGTRGEHRRNPSDVSVEKLVLRRWSGASDMSIDFSSNSTSSIDRKESGGTAGTPTSSDNLQHEVTTRKSENDDCGLIEASKSYARLSYKNSSVENSSSAFSSCQDHDRTLPKVETQTSDAVHEKVNVSASKEPPGLTKEEQPNTWTHTNCSLEGLEHGGICDQVVSQSRTKVFFNSREVARSREPAASQTNFRSASEDLVSHIPSRTPLALAVPSEPKDQASLLAQPRNQIEVDELAVKTQPTSVYKFSSFSGKMEDTGPKSMCVSDSQIQFKSSMGKMEGISAKGDSGHPENQGSSFDEKLVARPATITAAQVPSKVNSAKARQGSASVGLRFSGKTSGTDKKFQGKRDEIVPSEESHPQTFQSRKINEGMEALPFSLEGSQTARPNKDNHELNDVLHLKAEELEKLFAEHKLKNHSDHIASARRRKTLSDHATKSAEKRFAQSPPKQKPEKILLRQDSTMSVEFDSDLLPGTIENFDLCDIKAQQVGSHTPTDVPRGKLYGKYMLRRDAKLSQECGSKRAQKEAKMKAMHDSLELSQAEMKARLASFSNRQNLTDARCRAEKMRSFNGRSTLKVKGQFCKQTSESLTGDGDDDEQELPESSTDNQSSKLSSSTSLTSVSPTPKHLVKSTNSNSLRHRGQTENPLAQSVPTFSDFKNENMKPLAAVTKATARVQPRSFARSKSSIEDAEISKEDRSHWSNITRKNSFTHAELKDLSSLDSEKTFHDIQMSGEFKQYVKKGNGANHGSGAAMGKSRSSITPENLKNKEKFEKIVNQKEDSLDIAIDDDEFESAYAEGNNLIMDIPIDSDGEKPRHSQLSGEPESENGDLMRPLSHLDGSSIIFSKFNCARNAEDSAEESSGSLNSHGYHSVGYTREASDIYGSSDFTADCTSWNSHSLSQIMDSEAARMRKKWGSAQIPVISASASQQSRRDVTKGFKRLLKFGRKSRGTDYLVNDWFSASTTSEGDDDPEDGRDLVHKPSDDFRKSRMGYSTTYDGFNDGDIFPEQAQSMGNSIANPPNPMKHQSWRHVSLVGRWHPSESSASASSSVFPHTIVEFLVGKIPTYGTSALISRLWSSDSVCESLDELES
ncbi:uncharacterized protein LOC110116624 [Dendrobium catenatum]|nr:uncharacterized protein LOC110116624 [Dendrobium catenatum]